MSSGQSKQPKMMVENISCIIPETEAMGGLFLGNTYGSQNPDILKQYGIRAVLTTSIETPVTYDPVAIPFHLKIQAHDKKDYEIYDHLEESLEFIHKYRQVTNVFVHCYAGVSRSSTIIIAYLMKHWKWNLKTALAFVQNKRVVANPNEGFMLQLKKYEDFLYSQSRPASGFVHQNHHLNANHQSQHHLAYTQGFSLGHAQKTEQSIEPKKAQVVYTTPSLQAKKHSETPIPKILTAANQKRQQGKLPSNTHISERHHASSTSHMNMRTMQPSMQANYNTNMMTSNVNANTGLNSLQAVKSTKALIRPKDLPGYKS